VRPQPAMAAGDDTAGSAHSGSTEGPRGSSRRAATRGRDPAMSGARPAVPDDARGGAPSRRQSGGQSPRGRGGDEQIHLTTATLQIWPSLWRLRVRAWLCPAAATAAPDEAMTICLHATKMRWLQPGETATMNARGDPDMLLDDDDGGRRINRIRRLNRGAAPCGDPHG